MIRFQKLQTDKTLINHFIDKLIELGYKRVPDFTGGDEDFLMIDTLRKEYIWCENGAQPFCDPDTMSDFESVSDPKSITLRNLAQRFLCQ